ncbi:MAG: hypothetical protein OHM57_09375 [Spiroplasma phoeniceum]|nr:MAG: hypothetical protein OHM57_09375 [Spiroplasma phoeniceum]
MTQGINIFLYILIFVIITLLSTIVALLRKINDRLKKKKDGENLNKKYEKE